MRLTLPIAGLVLGAMLLVPFNSFAQSTTAATIQSWKDSAKRGSVIGPYSLGYSYEHGQGVKQDLAEAVKWYSVGAERGDLQAALQLANMYLNGRGIRKDESKAIEWFVKIGQSESWFAPLARAHLLLLARNYSLGGQGIKPDMAKAHALFEHLYGDRG